MTKVSDRKKEEKREKEKNEKDREKSASVTSDDDRRRQRRGRVNSNERPAAKGKRSDKDNDEDDRSIEKLILPLLRGNENPFEGERAFFRSESDLKFSSGKREGASTSAST